MYGHIYGLWNIFVKEGLCFLDSIENKEEFMEEYDNYYIQFVFKSIVN
jgi:hypothetical protein